MDADIVVDHGGAEDPPIGTWRGLRADGLWWISQLRRR
jgi:hypothetical protein